MSPIAWIIVVLALLQVKHTFADYFLQTPRMLSGRVTYLHVGRAQHVGVHLLGTAIALMFCGVGFGALLGVLVFEAIAHYHIDWGKGVLSERNPMQPTDANYWRLHGIDQLLHQLTYVAILFAVC